MTDKELFYDELLEAMHENPLFEGASFVEREIPKNNEYGKESRSMYLSVPWHRSSARTVCMI